MARRLSSILFLACLVLVWPAVASRAIAQQAAPPQDGPPPDASDAPPPSYSTPPAITLVDGSARLLRQGQSQPAVANMPLIEGDRITTEGGRVAVTYPDGSLLHLDRNTTIDFLSMSLARLLDGRLILVAAGQGDERTSVDYQVDAPAGSVRVSTPGEYRISTRPREVELDVVTGSASLATDQGSVRVEAGERSFAQEGQAPSDAEAFNSAQLDGFDQWSEEQREANTAEAAGASTQYLPSDLEPYSGTFDRYGRWENDATYGYVWYPTVSTGWRPYYNGYWDYVGPYGWTWIGLDAWAWPTHHFGRWGFRAGLWFWVPRRYWAPAWVSWGYAPGYYSWCPLDFYNRPLISLSFFFGGRHGYRGAFDPWLCWTVLPRDHFGRGYHVSRFAVAGDRLPGSARGAFVSRRGGPDTPRGVARSFDRGDPRGGTRVAMARALPSVTMSARPRESAFTAGRAVPRGGVGSARVTAPRSDRRSLPYSAPGQRYDRAGSGQNGAMTRGTTRLPGSYDARGPSSRMVPRGSDRPSGPATGQPRGYQSAQPRGYQSAEPRGYQSAQPRGYQSAQPRGYQSAQPRGYQSAPYSRGPASRNDRPGWSSPGRVAPAQPRGGNEYTSPRYSAPATRGQPYAAPRYSAPAPRYSTPPAPRYSAPPSRSYSAPPRYSAPAAPRYSAPSSPRYSPPSYSAPAPRYSAPSYSAPRSSPGSAAPRGGGSAPRSGPSSRPAPSGGGHRGGRG